MCFASLERTMSGDVEYDYDDEDKDDYYSTYLSPIYPGLPRFPALSSASSFQLRTSPQLPTPIPADSQDSRL